MVSWLYVVVHCEYLVFVGWCMCSSKSRDTARVEHRGRQMLGFIHECWGWGQINGAGCCQWLHVHFLNFPSQRSKGSLSLWSLHGRILLVERNWTKTHVEWGRRCMYKGGNGRDWLRVGMDLHRAPSWCASQRGRRHPGCWLRWRCWLSAYCPCRQSWVWSMRRAIR